MAKSGWPYCTVSPFSTRISRITPATSAVSSFIIFIISRTQSVCPASTASPTSTNAGACGEGAR